LIKAALRNYDRLAKDYRHDTIRHCGGVHFGIYRQVGAKHLHRYRIEFGFRYNQRKGGRVARSTKS
jgi:hypothetical protein